jgi:hypothetical protein
VLRHQTSADVRLVWVDTSRFTSARLLGDRVRAARTMQPCDLLFVHRDADNQPPDWRYTEIREAVGAQMHVAVVPVRMTETWLLVEPASIRAAAGRVSGGGDLGIPKVGRLEEVADPKRTLRDAFVRAHAATGRRARRFDPAAAVHRLADLVVDWAPLRQLSAFQRLESDTRAALASLGLPLDPEGT